MMISNGAFKARRFMDVDEFDHPSEVVRIVAVNTSKELPCFQKRSCGIADVQLTWRLLVATEVPTVPGICNDYEPPGIDFLYNSTL